MERLAGDSMIKNNKGFTLVEVLTAISLLALVFLMASSIYFLMEKQWNLQIDQVQDQSNMRLAMNVLTKALRSADHVDFPDNHTMIINNNDVYQFNAAHDSLEKNGQTIVNGLSNVTFTPGENKVTIKITGENAKGNGKETLMTSIYIERE